MSRLSRFTNVVAGISLAVLIVLTGSPVDAQSQTNLSISPLRTETTISPGFVDTGEVQIRNTGDEPQNISLSAETFDVTNEQYDYLFTADTEESGWVQYDIENFTLQPGEEKVVRYSVNVPLEAEPRGYYIALLATHHAESSASGVTASARVTSLLYVSVDGDIERSGLLIKLSSPAIVFGDTGWSALLQNNGTVHYRSNYSVTVSNLIGQTINSTTDSRLILPNSIRLIEGELSAPEILGIYKVAYSVGLGDNPGHQETRWFLYLPPLQIILLILIIAGLIVIKKHPKRAP